jgi:hypothetical protein
VIPDESSLVDEQLRVVSKEAKLNLHDKEFFSFSKGAR